MDAGVTHVYRRANTPVWGDVATLSASDANPGQRFGYSVGTSNGCILVGAPGDDDNGAGAGAAYVYCNIPPLALLADIEIICCIQIPDFSTGPVEFEIHWENALTTPLTVRRSVQLLLPDGNLMDVVEVGPIEIDAGLSVVETHSVDLPRAFARTPGAAQGDYALILEWTDTEGNVHDDLVTFVVAAPAVPLLPWGGLFLLASIVLILGTVRSRAT
jgi:hypothetical protein